jgi:hypothetical protein
LMAHVADDRIVVRHGQDHGILWSVGNAFARARSGYGSGVHRQNALTDAMCCGGC